jgi:phospholipase D
MSKRKYRNLFNVIAISLLVGMFIGYAGNNRDVLGFLDNYFKPQAIREVTPVLIGNSEIGTCFTPPSGCGAVIANQISKAQESIHVQAYGFTSGEIAKALINANNRGVKVRVLLDKSNIGAKYSKMRDLRKAGIEVLIDEVSGIAHNKIIIIDGSAVITGSFNFTTSADIRNTENVIIVQNKPLAQKYLQNWHARYEMSHARITKN